MWQCTLAYLVTATLMFPDFALPTAFFLIVKDKYELLTVQLRKPITWTPIGF